jgi:enoyl-CoA hydratase/carnithine racemase
MPGQRAFELGMVDHVVPTLDELPAATLALATKLATGGPHALRATKNLLNQLDDSANAALIKRGADLSAQVVGMEETKALLRGKMAK